jgi:hypothetical protein
LIIIDSKAGDEPVNETRKPPSWLLDSITPVNIPSPAYWAERPLLRMPVQAISLFVVFRQTLLQAL